MPPGLPRCRRRSLDLSDPCVAVPAFCPCRSAPQAPQSQPQPQPARAPDSWNTYGGYPQQQYQQQQAAPAPAPGWQGARGFDAFDEIAPSPAQQKAPQQNPGSAWDAADPFGGL
jgi:hypothetical protein